jgi:RNA polymerase sigma-70 factor (ECF subfamily)
MLALGEERGAAWPSIVFGGAAAMAAVEMGQTAEAVELADLLARIATGDRAAFRRLYDLQSSRLYAAAMRITRQPMSASDATHDAFMQVWNNAGRFQPERGPAEAWLLGLVRYRALDIARRRVREIPTDEMPEVADDEPDALERLSGSEDAAALGACLGQLPEDRRRLLMLAYVDGLSQSQLAERENLPLGTVKTWMRRSLQALRQCLEGGA